MKKLIIVGFALALTATPALADPPSHGGRSSSHGYGDSRGYANDGHDDYRYDDHGRDRHDGYRGRHARQHAREEQRRHHRQHHREQRRHHRYGH